MFRLKYISLLSLPLISILLPKLTLAKEVELRFSVTDLYAVKTGLVLSNGQKIELKRKSPSPEYTYRTNESGIVYLYPEGTDPKSSGAQPVCQFQVGKELKSANVLLVPHPEDRTYRAFAIDDAAIANGGIFFLNATDNQIALKLDEETFGIDAMSTKLYVFENTASENNKIVMIRRKKGSSDEWKKFYSSVWRLIPSRKEINIFYQDEGSDKVKIKCIADY